MARTSVCARRSRSKSSVQEVNDAILTFKNYKNWNTFVYDGVPPAGVNGPADVKVGMGIQFSSTGIPPGVNSTSTDIITSVERPYFAAWENVEYENLIGHSEHCLLSVPLSNGYTQFTHWQTQLGAEAGNLYHSKVYFQRAFEIEVQDLKRYVEST
ncbi:hypothetical protein CC80DRAFT_493858 [Byssothecium circinans]|uniref:Uncharacterized protein n=1 Tax=Byssothecium circinans TaxID=147558 RepID=A0A6A5TRP2_9PLEO|nr:hypothetical protein CC80DRAFT_493858 [Byssothecium circinans]